MMIDTLHHHRWLVQTGIAIVILLGALVPSGNSVASHDKSLSFYHTHTKDRLEVVYWRDGKYVLTALAEINRFLSDFRTGEVAEIDPSLLDLIYDVKEQFGGDGTYQVISAYRSPSTNEMLRNRSASSGVAKDSQHTHARAIDVRLEGVSTKRLRDQALAMKRGGVGYYGQSDFIHMDTGRVRSW